MVRSITPKGYVWAPVNFYSECPCGINRWDCTYHKPECKPIKSQKLTIVVIDGKEYIKGIPVKDVKIPLSSGEIALDLIIDPKLYADQEKASRGD